MRFYRNALLATSVLTSLACLVLAGCSVSTQAGSPPPTAPPHERRHEDHAASATKAPKADDGTPTEKVKPTETKNEVPPPAAKNEAPASKQTAPPVATPETLPAAGVSRIVVPITVPIKAVKDKLDDELPATEERDWKRVTKPGKKHEVEVRYTVWRDPTELSVQGSTVRVVVPVRYASEFRVKVKKPIGKGSFWLTHGETWGTKGHPQRMEVTVDLALSVRDDYQLESHSKLVSIKHGAPPSGNACAKAGVEICVPKKDLASYVEDELNDHLGRKIEKALKKGDAKVGKLFDLRKRVSTLWSGLATPVELQRPNQVNCPTAVGEACSHSAWLAFAPSGLGLSPLEQSGDNLGVRVELQGKLAVTETEPKAKTPRLPGLRSITGGSTFELATTVDIPLTQVTQRLEKALTTTPFRLGSASLKLKSASLRVTDGARKAVSLEIVTEKEQKLGFATTLDYDGKKKLFGLARLVPDSTTKALLEKELKDLDLAALTKAVDEHATVALDKASQALRRAVASALSTALPGKLRLKGTLDDFALEGFSLSEKAITATIVLKGPLGVEFTP